VRLVGLKFLNRSGSGSTSDAILALQYAHQKGIRVSNNSWGGGGYSQALYNAIDATTSVGHLFVAAAGNSGVNTDVSPHYPSSYDLDNVIAVASITSADARSSFSNYGLTSVDLGAPGSSIYSTLPGDKYGTYSGTSMATPHVSGAVALVMSLHPDWGYGELRDAILETARPIPALGGITVTGGTLDVAAAVEFSPDAPPPAPDPPTVPALTASAVSNKTVTLSWGIIEKESGFELGRVPYNSRSGACGNFSVIKTLPADATSTTDSRNSGTYCYAVRSFNEAGTLGWSNSVTVLFSKK
jgi:subtilisin family serine protease